MLFRLWDSSYAIPPDVSRYANLERKIPMPWNPYSLYGVGNQNNTDRSILWETLDTTPGEIALDHEEAKALGLPQSQDFPWDRNRGIYLVNGFHQVHCLRKIQRWVTLAYHNASQLDNYQHVVHCMDMLRQDIICNADDTPLYTSPTILKDAGQGQVRMCRSWDQLTTWAQRQTDCYAMINETQGVDTIWARYRYCNKNSPYYDRMKQYLRLPDDWNGEKPAGISTMPPYWEAFTEIEFDFNEYSTN